MRKDFGQNRNSSWLQATKDPPSCRNVLTLILFAFVSGCCNGPSGRPINTRYTTPPPVPPSSLFPPPTPDSIPQTSQKQTQAQTLKKPFLKTPLHLKMGMLFAPFVPSVFHLAGSMAGYHSCPFPSLSGQSAQRCCTNDNTSPRRL